MVLLRQLQEEFCESLSYIIAIVKCLPEFFSQTLLLAGIKTKWPCCALDHNTSQQDLYWGGAGSRPSSYLSEINNINPSFCKTNSVCGDLTNCPRRFLCFLSVVRYVNNVPNGNDNILRMALFARCDGPRSYQAGEEDSLWMLRFYSLRLKVGEGSAKHVTAVFRTQATD